jgi:hypothetical protein
MSLLSSLDILSSNLLYKTPNTIKIKKSINRLSIGLDAYVNPISYSLLGRRMTRKEVLIQVAATIISIIIGMVKSSLE